MQGKRKIEIDVERKKKKKITGFRLSSRRNAFFPVNLSYCICSLTFPDAASLSFSGTPSLLLSSCQSECIRVEQKHETFGACSRGGGEKTPTKRHKKAQHAQEPRFFTTDNALLCFAFLLHCCCFLAPCLLSHQQEFYMPIARMAMSLQSRVVMVR